MYIPTRDEKNQRV